MTAPMDHAPISPAEFARRMHLLEQERRAPWEARAIGVGIMALTLGSIGYGAGLEDFLKATEGMEQGRRPVE